MDTAKGKIKEALAFAKWISNNWWKPYGLPNQWRKSDYTGNLPNGIGEVFTTEDLYLKFTKDRIKNKDQ